MRHVSILITVILLICVINLPACKNHHGINDVNEGSDTLKVGMLYGPATYFLYRDEPMGYEYENIKKFADHENLILDIIPSASINSLLSLLRQGEIDIIASPVPVISEYLEDIEYVGPKEITRQVLVQRQNEELLKDVTQLVGKTVNVLKDSKYHFRLLNLNEEIGGGIDIMVMDKDSISEEDILEMVHNKEVDYTVVDSDIASLNKTYYPELDITMEVSLEQYSGWAVNKENKILADKINNYAQTDENREFLLNIHKKYFENSKFLPSMEEIIKKEGLSLLPGQKISNYDDLFKRQANASDFDWKFLAAIAFKESRFDSKAVSRFGASGLMQVMPSTAKALGVNPQSLISDPAQNVKAAVKLLESLDKALKPKVKDKDERTNFILGAYNAGLGHIYDAIALAKKLGLDTAKWQGNVREALLLKTNPKFYNLPIVKNGYLRGSETTEFVDNVQNVYNYFTSIN